MFKLPPRTAAIYSFDLTIAALSIPTAALLRLGWDQAANRLDSIIEMTAAFTLVSAVMLVFARLHRVAWRYISINDALLITATAVAANLSFLVLMFMWTRLDGVPRAVIPINVFIQTSLMIGSRIGLRLWHERSMSITLFDVDRSSTQLALLLGATNSADAFILANNRNPNFGYRIVGVLDSGHRPVGSLMRGVPVVGRIEEFEKNFAALVRRGTPPDIVIIADPKIKGGILQDIVDLAHDQSVRVTRLPDMTNLQSAEQPLSMQPIELGDLLARSETTLDHQAIERMVNGSHIMVTGAGGSIGSELVRQIAKLTPSHITLVEFSEFNLYEIDRDLASNFPHIKRSSQILDVRAKNAVRHCFETRRPDIVFHTAALKHVPLLENQPAQAVLTNVLGTQNVADACVEFDVPTMVLVSSDKAAHPVSIMGATKRIAESYCQSLDLETERLNKTRFITVRFGNVLGSAGSVVPLFQKQLAAGGPLTVTHRDMTRYFMTIREAVQLVLQAATLDESELERGHIVVLDMGEPVKILDLARQVIKLAGLRPDRDIKIVFTGLRPGERLAETLFQADEELVGTSFESLQVASAKVGDHAFIARVVEQLVSAAQSNNDAAVHELLNVAVSEFAARRAVFKEKMAEISTTQHSEI